MKFDQVRFVDVYSVVQIKDDLYKFQDMKPGDGEFEPTLNRLMERLREHMTELEGHDLVLLERELEVTESENLVRSFKRTSFFTPTR